MGIALMMARRGLGRTAPNPSVGAVVADPATGEILARAVTAPGGRPHAEPLVLAQAGDRARGATLYVTLEPCSHHGQTAPCADAIVAAGIARVVVAIEDPDPRVAGRGLARLRAAGIDVSRGLRAAEASIVTRGHVIRIGQRRPFIQLKLALDADGAVPRGADGTPLIVTSPEARALGHLLRAEADAILVGSGTVVADNPELTCRLPGMASRSPTRVVLARRGLDVTGTRLISMRSHAPLTVVTGPNAGHDIVSAMSAAGATVEVVAEVGGALWLPAVVERLAERGITRLLVEGGPKVWRGFAEAGLVDEIVLFCASAARLPEAAALDAVRRAIIDHLGAAAVQVADHRTVGLDRVWWLRTGHDPTHVSTV